MNKANASSHPDALLPNLPATAAIAIPTEPDPAAKGEPATSVSAPVLELIV